MVDDENLRHIRVRCASKGIVNGSFLEYYNTIYDYCHEILRTNLGSTLKVNVQPVITNVVNKRPYFHRFYICYVICKRVLNYVGLSLDLMDIF